MTKAIGYIRVSTDKQAESGLSLESQRKKIEAYCELYDLELVDVEVDAGFSAKSLKRPALRRALARLGSDTDTLIVVKLDRLTRSVKDLCTLVDKYFCGDQPSLISVAENLDTRSASGRLVMNILASVAQWEREVISERTSAALGQLRDQGRYTGGVVRYGYRVSEDGSLLEPNPEEQTVIDTARFAYAVGRSLRETAEVLNRKGYRTRQGGLFQANQVKKMVAA
jgi:DNA invertase Pin-like site-specific DNA recombinase